MFEGICDALHRELETIEGKVVDGPMSNQDLDHIDKIIHSLKSLATYEAMKEREGYVKERNRSRYYDDYRRY